MATRSTPEISSDGIIASTAAHAGGALYPALNLTGAGAGLGPRDLRAKHCGRPVSHSHLRLHVYAGERTLWQQDRRHRAQLGAPHSRL